MFILGQCVFALIVVFVLKKMLDKELMRAALEKFESCKASLEIKEIDIYLATAMNEEFMSHLEVIRKNKFAQARVNVQRNPDLKGGIVIKLGDLLLDFSLASRLQNFWS